MLGVDFLVMIGALIFFFLRAAEDADRERGGGGPRRRRARLRHGFDVRRGWDRLSR